MLTGSDAPRRPTGAGRQALDAFRDTPLSTRLHATLRWWSAPFPAVEAGLPAAGRVLEIGCGHGLFSVYAALAGRARSVVGVDIDAGKIAQAQAVAQGLSGADVSFRLAPTGAVPIGPWDAVVVIDMLYLLPTAEQRRLLAAAADQLGPGGVLLIKEMSPTPRWKAGWNRLQETMAVSILGITQRADGTGPNRPISDDRHSNDPAAGGLPVGSQRFDLVAPAVMAGWLRQSGLRTSSRRLDRHRLHPHHLLVGRRAAGIG
jgi:SAM-dependent methyltransferase